MNGFWFVVVTELDNNFWGKKSSWHVSPATVLLNNQQN